MQTQILFHVGSRSRTRLKWLLLLALFGWVASPAVASDGVREINQSAALAGSITAGDTPGVPVSIFEPGSYVLTSDLVVTGTANAIVVVSDDVTIDFNGFAIRGSTTCTGATGADLVCTPTSTGNATGVNGSGANVVVKNGRIRGMPNRAISCGRGCRIEGMELVENGQGGAFVDDASIVQNNIIRRNGGAGIGFTGSSGSRYVENTVAENAGNGLFAAPNSVITGNAAYRNGGTGIFTNPGSIVIGNTSKDNGGDGIRAYRGLVRENTVVDNDGVGLKLEVPDTLYSDNVIDSNGTTVTSGTQSGINWCNSNTTCP